MPKSVPWFSNLWMPKEWVLGEFTAEHKDQGWSILSCHTNELANENKISEHCKTDLLFTSTPLGLVNKAITVADTIYGNECTDYFCWKAEDPSQDVAQVM